MTSQFVRKPGLDTKLDDVDLYFFLVSYLLWRIFPNVWVRYHLFSRPRNPLHATRQFKDEFENRLRQMSTQSFPLASAQYLGQLHPRISSDYQQWLVEQYRINPSAFEVLLTDDRLHVYWEGPAFSAVLHEATIMSMVTKLRADLEHLEISPDLVANVKEFARLANAHDINVVQGGLRRRFSREVERVVTEILRDEAKDHLRSVSNLGMARELGMYSSGTIPHFLIMVMSAIYGPKEANIATLQHWSDMFLLNQGQEAVKRYGTFLPDTFGTPVGVAQLAEFYKRYPERRGLFPALREDGFGIQAMINLALRYNRYHNLGISTLVPSNGLDNITSVGANQLIKAHGFNTVQIIGTHLTHNMTGNDGVDIVAKTEYVWHVDQFSRPSARIPVGKLSDGGKMSGPEEAIARIKSDFPLQKG